MKSENLMTLGGALVLSAITPTPDDLTIVSPLIQFIGGSALIIYAITKKE